MDWEIGPGCRYALAIALAALVVLGLAASRPEAGKFLSEYQTLIAALVAIGAALVAYDGATAATREARRKDQITRDAQIVTTCLNLRSEVAGLQRRAEAVRRSVMQLPEGQVEADDADQIGGMLLGAEIVHLRHARDNIGAYGRDLRLPIMKLWGQYTSAVAFVANQIQGVEALVDDHDMREPLTRLSLNFAQPMIESAAAFDAQLYERLIESGVYAPRPTAAQAG